MTTETDPVKLLEQGRRYLAQRRLREAQAIAGELNTRYPNNPSVLTFLAEIALLARDHATAEKLMSAAVRLAPDRLGFRLKQAGAQAANGAHERALATLEEAARMKPDDPEALQAVGAFCSRLGAQEQARDLFTRALALQPDSAQLNQNLAAVHRFLGNLQQAEAFADRAVQLDPSIPEAVFIRSDVRRVTPDNNHIDSIRALLARADLDPGILTQCYFSLAKEYEDIGEYDRSFEALTEGCGRKRASFEYRVENEVERMAAIVDCYDAGFVSATGPGHQGSRTPVFILGMPRTGSTLVEQFLSGHSRVETLGERQEFSRHLTRHTQQILQRRGLGPEQMVAASREIDFSRLGQDYLTSVAQVGQGTPCFIDKMPLNFLYVGLILAALPQAKIIHTVRQPMDTCYAVYKMLFDRAYPFSYDLDELGRYYVAYEALMAHWYTLFGERICRVAYEDVVADSEREVRRLVDYLDLPWEDACLSNRATTIASTTASAAQARQPVYSSSVGLWRHYRSQLAPLHRRLQEAGLALD